MKKLGFGLMRLPMKAQDDGGGIDIEHMKLMVDEFIAHGFTYFDTAWMYCGHQSENAVKEALCSRHGRGTYTLATKLHANYINENCSSDDIFNEQLKKTGAGYFDYYLLHAINVELYEKYKANDCFNWLSEKKKQGLVKNIGFSFHDSAELLDKVLTEHPEMDFVQLQINYLDWDSESVQSRLCYETAVKHNKKVVVMEPVKGGTLANLPANAEILLKNAEPDMSAASWAIRFAASLENVMVVLSGMSNIDQMKDNLSFMHDFKPLNERELELIGKVTGILKASDNIPCTGCEYCVGGCPMSIPIPRLFSLYNAAMQSGDANADGYAAVCGSNGQAGDCIGCGQCEDICPQKLPIIENLKKIAKLFE